jgi:hypothetical protein
MDSLIRLRQLSQPDISGYIAQAMFPILQSSGLAFSGQNIYPTGSGRFGLGLSGLPFKDIFAHNLRVPSGSGIFFGPNFFTAYTSGLGAVIRVNEFTLAATSQGVSIIGPTGPTGYGTTGATGATGIGITGAVGQSGGVRFLYSNNTSGEVIPLPSGATGTGINLTGFLPSGASYILPLYSNKTTGSGIFLPSGATGPQGTAGGILIDCDKLTGMMIKSNLTLTPQVTIYNIDPYVTSNPTITLIKGMRYTIGQSGLQTTGITITPAMSAIYGIPAATYNTNFFQDESGTSGYMRFTVWSLTADSTGTYTGRIIYPESNGITSATLATRIKDSEVMWNTSEDPYKSSISFNVKYSAATGYKYGFARYALDGSLFDGSTEVNLGGLVLGSLAIGYFGPTGPTGAQGSPGLDGAQGEIGPLGAGGAPGVSVTGVYRNPSDGTQIRFQFSDGTNSEYITMPAGGPTGPAGTVGATGPAGSGATGPTGPEGIADKYYSSFFTNEINATSGISPSFNKVNSGSITWLYKTGDEMRFVPGDAIWFQHDVLKNKAYSTWQKVVFADNNYGSTKYFYAEVSGYDSTAGWIKVVINGSPYPPVGTSGGYTYWNQYSLMNLNLGGLGSQGISGASGAQGPIGPQGIAGNTGYPIFRVSPTVSGLVGGATNTIACSSYSALDLSLVDDATTIAFNPAYISSGQTVQLKIKNNSSKRNDEYTLIYWDTTIKFPYNVTAPGPNPTETSIYTFVRWADVAAIPQYYCTYTLNYV